MAIHVINESHNKLISKNTIIENIDIISIKTSVYNTFLFSKFTNRHTLTINVNADIISPHSIKYISIHPIP